MEIIEWDKKDSGSGMMARMSQQEAISLARSLLAQVDSNNPNTHRIEFLNVELIGPRRKKKIYFSIAVKDVDAKQKPNHTPIRPARNFSLRKD